MPPATSAAACANDNNMLLSLPRAWLGELVTSHLDSASRVALLQASRTLCELVLSAVPSARLTIDVSGYGVGPFMVCTPLSYNLASVQSQLVFA